MYYLNKNLIIEMTDGTRHEGACILEDAMSFVLKAHMNDGSIRQNKYFFNDIISCMEKYA
jgi:hypothetical protein